MLTKEDVQKIRQQSLRYHLKVYGAPPRQSSLDNFDDEEETNTMSSNTSSTTDFSSAEPTAEDLEEARKGAERYAAQRRRGLPTTTRPVSPDEPDYVTDARRAAEKFAEKRNRQMKKD